MQGTGWENKCLRNSQEWEINRAIADSCTKSWLLSCVPTDFYDWNTKGRALQMRDQGQKSYKAQTILGGGCMKSRLIWLSWRIFVRASWWRTSRENWAKFSCQMKHIDDEEPSKICGEVNEMQKWFKMINLEEV